MSVASLHKAVTKFRVLNNRLRLPPRYDDIEFSDDERLEELEERPNLKFPPSRPYKDVELCHSAGVIPASIAQYLRDYQIDGAAFLHELFVYQRGGILGDDMGLGKTIQGSSINFIWRGPVDRV
jgi:SNF2 family DNA or RNA helicase